MLQYFDKIVKGTEREDSLVILQNLKQMIGMSFSFLNYYKEIPVCYDAVLVNVDNEMAEFEIHDYQAKVISLDHKVLIRFHEKFSFREDILGEAFYVNVTRRKAILCKFGYARIKSDLRRFVRVLLDRPVEVDILVGDGESISGSIRDISLGGASMDISSSEHLAEGVDVTMILKLSQEISAGTPLEVKVVATVIKIAGEDAPHTCIVEFYPERVSQRQISYYINQRQVEIIKELKELKTS